MEQHHSIEGILPWVKVGLRGPFPDSLGVGGGGCCSSPCGPVTVCSRTCIALCFCLHVWPPTWLRVSRWHSLISRCLAPVLILGSEKMLCTYWLVDQLIGRLRWLIVKWQGPAYSVSFLSLSSLSDHDQYIIHLHSYATSFFYISHSR